MFSRKDLLRLLIPLIIEQILSATVGLADTLMVANVGEVAVSGVSLVDSVNLLLINVFAALATGGTIVASQYLGRNDRENANKAANQLVLVTAVFSITIMALCLLLRRPMLNLLFGHTEADVMETALIYFFLSALSYPFIGVYNSCAALFRATGNSKVPMAISALMNVINISGNAILIFGFHMGAAGAGLASLISRMTACLIALWMLRRPELKISLADFFPIVFLPQMTKNILRIGIPSGVENGMFQIGKILVQGIVAIFGTAAIAANAVGNSISSVTVMPGIAIGLGAVTVVGHCIGAEKYDEAKKYMRRLTMYSFASIVLLNAIILLTMGPILRLYDLSSETAEIAREIIIFHAFISTAFWAPAFTLPNGLRAANDVRFTMVTSTVTMWTLRVAGGYIISVWCGLGVLGVWVSMGLDWVFRMLLFVWRYKSNKWQNRQYI